MCLNGTYPFLSATLVRQLPYYLFRETYFMDIYLQQQSFYHKDFTGFIVATPRRLVKPRGGCMRVAQGVKFKFAAMKVFFDKLQRDLRTRGGPFGHSLT